MIERTKLRNDISQKGFVSFAFPRFPWLDCAITKERNYMRTIGLLVLGNHLARHIEEFPNLIMFRDFCDGEGS